MLESFFKLKEHGTTVRTEIIAGLTTFLTMAYILFVNPNILANTGMDHKSVFVATCIAAALGTIIMGVVANYPIGLAPGMGLNVFFTFSVVAGMGYTWQAALGAVFISGCIFVLITVLGLRQWLINGIPHTLRCSIAAGIGLFLAIIALKSAGVIQANPNTLVALGDLHNPTTLLAVLGFFIIAVLEQFRVRGSILIGILVVTALSIMLGLTSFDGRLISLPPSIEPTLFKLDILGALHGGKAATNEQNGLLAILHGGFVSIILTMVLVEIFDATGTMMGVAKRAGLLDENAPGNPQKRLGRALFADSIAILAGSVLGTSSTTAFIESASGVQAGGRTGLTALVIAVLFLAALFIAPLAGAVPPYATAPALLYVAGLMMRELVEVKWDDVTEAAPAALTALAMPFTYSIANGLAFGFISYSVLKLCTGRAREVHPAAWVISVLFLVKYAFFPG